MGLISLFFSEDNGNIDEFSTPYIPQQNGIIEYKNKTQEEIMNYMLISSGLSDNVGGGNIIWLLCVKYNSP